MKRLNFYDVKGKTKFMSSKYKFKTKRVKGRTRYFALAKAPSGITAWRIVSKKDYQENK